MHFITFFFRNMFLYYLLVNFLGGFRVECFPSLLVLFELSSQKSKLFLVVGKKCWNDIVVQKFDHRCIAGSQVCHSKCISYSFCTKLCESAPVFLTRFIIEILSCFIKHQKMTWKRWWKRNALSQIETDKVKTKIVVSLISYYIKFPLHVQIHENRFWNIYNLI